MFQDIRVSLPTVSGTPVSCYEEDMIESFFSLFCRSSSQCLKASAFLLSMASPVLQAMICGSFSEGGTRRLDLHDVDARSFSKVLDLFCGKDGLEEELDCLPGHGISACRNSRSVSDDRGRRGSRRHHHYTADHGLMCGHADEERGPGTEACGSSCAEGGGGAF